MDLMCVQHQYRIIPELYHHNYNFIFLTSCACIHRYISSTALDHRLGKSLWLSAIWQSLTATNNCELGSTLNRIPVISSYTPYFI